jgi:hypothetical protein
VGEVRVLQSGLSFVFRSALNAEGAAIGSIAALSTPSNAERLRLQDTTTEELAPGHGGVPSAAQPAAPIGQRGQSRQRPKRSIAKPKSNAPFNRKGKPPISKRPAS